jgi:hypothetical protein
MRIAELTKKYLKFWPPSVTSLVFLPLSPAEWESLFYIDHLTFRFYYKNKNYSSAPSSIVLVLKWKIDGLSRKSYFSCFHQLRRVAPKPDITVKPSISRKVTVVNQYPHVAV